MSTQNLQAPQPDVTSETPKKLKVIAFIDGLNLYHSIDCEQYRKYKWLCLTSLIKRFIAPVTEELIAVEYFTTYPTWDDAKKFRHMTFVSAQKHMGVNVTLGEFKRKTVSCYARCKLEFDINVEKQTDVNIATAMLDRATDCGKLLLLTADSDQVPTLKLLKKLHPEKQLAVVVPIGRKAKELKAACDGNAFRITEQHLIDCQLPNPIPIMRDGRQISLLVRPTSWPFPQQP